MKKILNLLLFLIAIPITAITQISQSEARPIDSALVAEFLDEGNFHTTNYHGVTFPPGGYWTWDAGCGLYLAIDDYFLAWSHTGMVADTLATCIDTMPNQAYRLFDLETMINTDAYKDSVKLWLGSLGIPVDIKSFDEKTIKIWPNPFSNLIKIRSPESGDFVLTIQNIEGRIVYNKNGVAQSGQTHMINLSHLDKGLFVIIYSQEGKVLAKKIIKQ